MIKNWKTSPLGIDKLKEISGKYTGLLTDEIFYSTGVNTGIHMNICTASLPNYEKFITGPNAEINYHLAGYGEDFDDSAIRLAGESVERAAGAFSHIYLKKKILNASYCEISDRSIDKKYMFTYLNSQLSKIHQLNSDFLPQNPSIYLKQNWIRAKSLFNPNKEVLVPENMFFFGAKSNQRTFLSVSTGTAAHITWKKALLNSLIEYIQIDAFMYSWYSGKKYQGIYLSKLKNRKIQMKINRLFGKYSEYFECLIIDISKYSKVPIYVFGVFLISKDGKRIPSISFGLQGGLKEEETVVRAFCEALASVKMSEANFIKKESFSVVNTEEVLDFDRNVEYFANPQNHKEIMKFLHSRIEISDYIDTSIYTVKNLSEILLKLKSVAPSASFLDITPPHISGYRVARVFIPEFLAMTFPSFPQLNHPRLKGDIKNDFLIHPMP